MGSGVCLCPGLLCDLRQVASPLWASITSSEKSDFAFFPGCLPSLGAMRAFINPSIPCCCGHVGLLYPGQNCTSSHPTPITSMWHQPRPCQMGGRAGPSSLPGACMLSSLLSEQTGLGATGLYSERPANTPQRRGLLSFD